VVMLDLLEHSHGASVAKALGPDALTLPKDQAARLAAIGAAVSAGTLSRLWQMLLKAYEEARRAPDPAAACEMALIRLCYAADLPGPEEALKALQAGEPVPGGRAPAMPSGGGSGGASVMARALAQPEAQPVAAPQTALQSFEDVVALIDAKRDIVLKLDVSKYMRPVSFRAGAIEFEPAPGAPGNLAQRLSAKLKEWTGQPWLVAAQGGGGAESLMERANREKAAERKAIEADPFVQSVMQAFPGAEIVSVRQLAAPEAAAGEESVAEEED
jgi:DNA polymerase-3 subunit gamma/tau